MTVNQQCLLGIRILLVENDELNQLVAQELLHSYGAKVDIASEGMEGVHKALDSSFSFDVILMDMQLPDIDGLEATRQIREHKRMLSTPIIALTGSAQASDKAACAEAGMVSHISKPFDIKNLLATILHYVQFPNEILYTPQSEPDEITSSMDYPVLDAQWAITRMGGKSQMYWQVVKHFKVEAGHHVHSLQHAHIPDVMISLHTLKSISGSVGAFALQHMVSQVERCLQNLQSELRDVSVHSALRKALARAVEHALEETVFELERLEKQEINQGNGHEFMG
jgi:CheY-like chemotaxis protein